jgi:8-oxo-dGTP pyrophosphatase MutT (NUDIX family)
MCALAVIASVAAMLVSSPNATARDEFFAAGVMLIAHKDDNTFILLGKPHLRRWYEFFGGRQGTVTTGEEPRRPETAYETALRECHEESRGYLSLEFLRDTVEEDEYLVDGGFIYFHAVIEPFAVSTMREAPVPNSYSPLAFFEIADYAWVNVNAVLASQSAVVVDDTGRSIEVRPQLKKRVQRAREAGWLD